MNIDRQVGRVDDGLDGSDSARVSEGYIIFFHLVDLQMDHIDALFVTKLLYFFGKRVGTERKQRCEVQTTA
jgi:hypothetical protein